MRAVRIWFTKSGGAKYISHLDLMRYMTRMFRKTGLKLYYTQGFNPRMHMIFTLSLPLGVEGLNECFDIRLAGGESDKEVLSLLKAISTPEIAFSAVTEPKYCPADIRYAEYSAQISPCGDKMKNHILSALSADALFAFKKNKRGVEKKINLLECLVNTSVEESADGLVLNFTLPAGNLNNISPLLFLETLLEGCGYNFKTVKIARKGLLVDNMKNYA